MKRNSLVRTIKLFCVALLSVTAVIDLAAQTAVAPAFLLSTTSLEFTSTGPGMQPEPKKFFLASSTGPVIYDAKIGYASVGQGWLSVTPTTGMTPANLTVSVDPRNLAPGAYMGYVEITSADGAASFVTVAFTVEDSRNMSRSNAAGSSAIVEAAPAAGDVSTFPVALSFQYQMGTAGPRQKPLIATRPAWSGRLKYTASHSWITIQPHVVDHSRTSATATASSDIINIGVNPAGLPAGSYSGHVTLETEAGTVRSVPVILSVCPDACLSVEPSILIFHTASGEPAAALKTVQVGSTGRSLNYTATIDSGSWIAIGPGAGSTLTSNNIAIAADATMPPGMYTGSVTITARDTSSSLKIPVVLDTRATTGAGLSVDPTGVTVTAALGGSKQTKQIAVTSSSGSETFHVVDYSEVPNSWLSIAPPTGTAPATVTLTFDPKQVSLALTYSASVLFSGNQGDLILVPVTFTVTNGTSATLTATPTSLTFSQTLGGTPPASQTIHLAGSPSGTSYTASPSQGWILVSPESGAVPQDVSVTMFTNGMTTGTYNGSISITGGPSPITIPITLTIAASTVTLTSNPASLTFTQTTGGAAPAAQTLTVSGVASGTAFTASAGPTWLSISPLSGSMPATITVTPNSFSLAPGTYSDYVRVTSGGGVLQIPVSLTIASAPITTTTVTPTTLTFGQSLNGSAAGSQTIKVDAPAAGTSFTATADQKWLTISPASGVTPSNITVTASGTGLAAGSYQSTITVTAGGKTATVAVTFTISTGALTLTPTPTSLSFTQMIGGTAAAAQTLHVDATTTGTSYTASSTAPWLSITPATGTTPADLSVTVTPTNMFAGTYQTTITIAAGSITTTVPVTLTLTNSGPLFATPSSIVFTQAYGGTAPAPKTLHIDAPAGGTNFNATVNAPWLSLSAASGTTPADLTLTVNAAGLGPRTYQVSISITVGNYILSVPVTLNITGTVIAVSAVPGTLSFSQTLGAATAPAQTVRVDTSSSGTPFTATPSATWVVVSPATGPTPANMRVSINPTGMAAGKYSATINVTAGTGSVSVPVSLTIAAPTPAPTPTSLAAQPATLSFAASGNSSSQPQPVTVSSGGSQLTLAVAASTADGAAWLSATPSTATTPAPVMVNVNAAGLAAGQYSGSITLTPSDRTVPAVTVAVALTVSVPTQTNTKPVVVSILSAASIQPAPVAPGEIITIFGSGLGPTTGSGPQLSASGAVSSTNAGTQVLFDNIAAPLLYVRGDQINAVVPYGIYGRTSTTFQVTAGGVKSDPIFLRVADAVPALFTLNASGAGQGAVLNQDGTTNSIFAPATRGSAISIYATGEGQTTPGGVDGHVITTDLRTPLAPVSVKIGGTPATVLYAGSAPGLISGVLQINVVVPPGIAANAQAPVEVTIGGVVSQAGVTMAIK